MSLYMKLPFSLQAPKTEEMAPSTPISETRSSRDPSTSNRDIENSRCTRHLRHNGQDIRSSKIRSPQNPYWSSSVEPFQGTAPAIAIQGTGVPEILPPPKRIFKGSSSTSKQGFWSSRILPPQTWYWSILAYARNWMFQRSFHFKIWNWKLQMPEASSASIQRFGSSRTLLHQFWYWML